MIFFSCHVCRTQLSAEEAQAGQLVRCPTCLTTLRAPEQQMAATSVVVNNLELLAGAARGGSGRRYGFNCAYCASRLEATEAMAAQDGKCPTCGNNITIPILDRYGRLIDPKTRQIIKQDPHPVHAYAAAGDRAPKIIRHDDGRQSIQCVRCGTTSTVSSNNCKSCGMPFTIEGTTLAASGISNGYCVASLVLGIIGMPAFCTVITPLLAIIFGVIGYSQIHRAGGGGSGKRLATIGIVSGTIGCAFIVWYVLARIL